MLRPVYWILRWVLAFALLGFMVAVVRVTAAPLTRGEGWDALMSSAAIYVVVAGFAARWVLARLPGGDPLELVDTLEHELTHAIVGTLTFAPPVALTATLRDGGEVELKRSNPLAALAPYCLPLFAFLLALLTLVLRDDYASTGRLAVAFLLGSFFWRLLREFHFGQSDFRAYGFVFSMVFIVGALPVCLIAVSDLGGLLDVPWTSTGDLFLEQAQWALGRINPQP
jgi:hypothetical protein